MTYSLAAISLMSIAMLNAQEVTRGVGVYPGDPHQDFSPSMVVESSSYRNLAFRHPAYHSSSYDYNLTAQLVTDGIEAKEMPRWVSIATSQAGVLPKNQRDYLLDRNPMTSVSLTGPAAWVQFEWGGGDGPPAVDRLDVQARVDSHSDQPEGWTCVLSGSDDGQAWKELGRSAGADHPARDFKPSIALAAPARNRFYRIDFYAPSAVTWRVSELAWFDAGHRVEAGGPYDFTSAWMSATDGQEWVYVDLGAPCVFDRVKLYWIKRAAEGALQVSDDAAAWRTLQPLSTSDDIQLAQPATGRYVRVLMTRPAERGHYILSEFEVYGRGGPQPQPHPAPPPRPDGRLDLAGGAWRVERDSLVEAKGEAISQPGFKDNGWLVATVPGTVLTSYYNAGAVPDPNFGDNQLQISDSFFWADFWYRTEFVAPPVRPGGHLWLNFDGINWKADVYLNGELLGRIDGGFMRGRFDVTARLHPGAPNALAVRILKNATPGSVREKTLESPDKNGGALGADNPTYHASIGWDWIPVIRGRNTGIWGSVYLCPSGPVTLEDPFVSTTLPDKSHADVSIEVTLRNHAAQPVKGTLRGHFGEVVFSTPVTIAAGAVQTVKLNPATHPALRLQNPKLWWPAGYGEPNLYPVELRFETAGRKLSDSKSFQAGVRQFTYTEEAGALKIWINGRRLAPRGGNWGFGESMLRYRAREYDTAVRYHSDMHFTMIRNWVGQVGDDEFFQACDKFGVVVWQDFWLANPMDGPNPDDNDMFLRNVQDMVLRIRNHPSIGLYCGRNEGNPPKVLDDGMRKILAELHPGLRYIPNSAMGLVSGGGPYRFMPPKFYFQSRQTPKLHSELGQPNVVSLDSLRAMLPASGLWPQGALWGIHDFCLGGAQFLASFRQRIDQSYGGATSLEDWLTLAQFVNYEGYRAMFEAQGKNRMGMLLWMSHPAWPSFVWQTYDYYFEPTAGYFGSKKGSEPLHIQWNPVTDSIDVVNYSAGDARGLTARVELLNMDGTLKWEKAASLDSPEDSIQSPIKMEYPAGLSPVHFLRLKLTRGTQLVSENFYWRGLEEGNFRALRELPKVKLEAATTVQKQSQKQSQIWSISTEIYNPSSAPAVMVHLKAVRETSRDRILPAMYSDNYLWLMPGERRAILTEVQDADARGEKPQILVEGFNIGEVVYR